MFLRRKSIRQGTSNEQISQPPARIKIIAYAVTYPNLRDRGALKNTLVQTHGNLFCRVGVVHYDPNSNLKRSGVKTQSQTQRQAAEEILASNSTNSWANSNRLNLGLWIVTRRSPREIPSGKGKRQKTTLSVDKMMASMWSFLHAATSTNANGQRLCWPSIITPLRLHMYMQQTQQSRTQAA